MLNIYYGRENLDKEKFIFDNLDLKKKNLIIVPDQFSLEMEEDMFSYLNVTSLINTEVTSFSKLGFELLRELGGSKRTFLDKYGRHMLLSKIVKEERDDLRAFSSVLDKPSFITVLNNFISELKQEDVTTLDLDNMLENLDEDSDSYKKIYDLKTIYTEYEKRIDGIYTDSEDRVNLYISKIKDSKKIKNSNIYVYGFDSIPPKSLNILKELLKYSDNVNVILSYDENDSLFDLTKIVMDRLISISNDYGINYNIEKISDSYIDNKKDLGIQALEKSLFSNEDVSYKSDNVKLIKASSINNEMETVSSYILHLLRDKKYKPSEIRIILNDKKGRENLLRRMLVEYNLNTFSLINVSISDTIALQYVLSLFEIVKSGYKAKSVIKLIKSGFSDLTFEEGMTLETYIRKYKVNFDSFKKPFYKGEAEYKDKLLEIEELRNKLINPVLKFEEITKAKTVGDFIDYFYKYLDQDLNINKKLEEILLKEEDEGRLDLAEKTSQVFNLMISILEQIREILKDDKFEINEFYELFKIGLSEATISILPISSDSITIDTMERQRMGRNVKAVIVVGMNEGVIPMNIKKDDILTNEERNLLNKEGKTLFKTEKIIKMEEKLAIYRNLSKAHDELFITYSTKDSNGEALNESSIYKRIKEIFKDSEKEDVIKEEDFDSLVNLSTASFRHLTEELSKLEEGCDLDSSWEEVLNWYKINDHEKVEKLKKVFRVNNSIKSIGNAKAKRLYIKNGSNISLGPTSIEEYLRCPFKFYINKGLSVKEEEIYESKGADFGTFSHDVISNFSRILNRGYKKYTWHTITDDEITKLVKELVEEEINKYKEELFRFNKEEEYRARRLLYVIIETCKNLVMQVRTGKIKEMYFEEEFKRGGTFKPLTFNVDNDIVYVEGRIDRVDILENDAVKIIDYKTGGDIFDLEKAKAGYQIQLMVYLKAAQEDTRMPGAILYFHIKDPIKKVDSKEEVSIDSVKEIVEKSFKMNGLIIEDDTTIDCLDSKFETTSNIIPITKAKGGYRESKTHMPYHEFKKLQDEVINRISDGIRNLASGNINISPLRIKRGLNGSACEFCKYNGICRFNEEIPGSAYRES